MFLNVHHIGMCMIDAPKYAYEGHYARAANEKVMRKQLNYEQRNSTLV